MTRNQLLVSPLPGQVPPPPAVNVHVPGLGPTARQEMLELSADHVQAQVDLNATDRRRPENPPRRDEGGGDGKDHERQQDEPDSTTLRAPRVYAVEETDAGSRPVLRRRPRAPCTHRRRRRLHPMKTYVILRRNGWKTAADLGAAAERSRQVGDEEMSDDISWIRSYVLEEADGTVGTVCIYQASSAEAVREHAARAGLPADEVIPVADTVLVRPDPTPAAA